MKNLVVIAFAGAIGAGKDTCGTHLRSTHHRFRRYIFAGPLKKMLATLPKFPASLSSPYWDDQDWKKLGIGMYEKTPRQMMQTLGTEWGRNLVHDDIWLRIAAYNLEQMPSNVEGVTIADCRFENEAAWIRSIGGTVCTIQRPSAEHKLSHASELGLEHNAADFNIINDGSLDFLYAQVDRAYDFAVERSRSWQK